MSRYETEIKVRFGDIDHAGIVFYPRVANYLHIAMEEFFADRVGLPYHLLLDERRLGLPTVHADITYREPMVFGDVARVELAVLEMGRSSLTIRYRIRKNGGDSVAVTARITTVCVEMEGFTPVPIPEDLREVFAAHSVSRGEDPKAV